jgi:5-formyltetrahydrofolate cyclo-ligase
MSTAASKTELRRHFIDVEKNRTPQSGEVSSLIDRLNSVVSETPGTWAAFQPDRHEPAITPLFEKSNVIEWAFPKVSGDHLEFFVPESQDAFTLSPWKIREPIEARSKRVALEDLRGFLIPGIAFDRTGHRLGRGRGFYDRLLGSLKQNNVHPIKIGVAFSWQTSEQEFPCESHDVPMDIVVTESSVRRCSSLERTSS